MDFNYLYSLLFLMRKFFFILIESYVRKNKGKIKIDIKDTLY